MSLIYNALVHIAWFHLKVVALFHPKIKLFVSGRKTVFSNLKSSISRADEVIWVHVASLGEFEQGLPIIERLKSEYPTYKMLVTFFSPSGYEVKKRTAAADVVVYLPMDTRKNVHRFLELSHPKLAIFVKYEIWPNYLKELERRSIPTLLISGIFKKDQIYFRRYGKFMRKALHTFSYFFVQDDTSKELLESIGIKNVSISGDTRFDRVSEILEQNNSLSFMHRFKENIPCLVAGSTWPEDESILVNFINASTQSLKYVIAPHNIKKEHINDLKKSILKNTVLFSEIKDQDLTKFDVLVVDTIGILTKIYSYADIAYVGGGFATGLHNTLEPAVFGIPVIIGPNYHNFNEAKDLVARKGLIVVNTELELAAVMNDFLEEPLLIKKTGQINSAYVAKKKGASIQVMDYIRELL